MEKYTLIKEHDNSCIKIKGKQGANDLSNID